MTGRAGQICEHSVIGSGNVAMTGSDNETWRTLRGRP